MLESRKLLQAWEKSSGMALPDNTPVEKFAKEKFTGHWVGIKTWGLMAHDGYTYSVHHLTFSRGKLTKNIVIGSTAPAMAYGPTTDLFECSAFQQEHLDALLEKANNYVVEETPKTSFGLRFWSIFSLRK